MMVYDFWIARIHPALASWNAQNITPTPPLWDVVLSLSPALFFAGVEALVRPQGGSQSPNISPGSMDRDWASVDVPSGEPAIALHDRVVHPHRRSGCGRVAAFPWKCPALGAT
jgi:hypothetical protein